MNSQAQPSPLKDIGNTTVILVEDSQTEQMERKAFALPDPGQKPYSDLAS